MARKHLKVFITVMMMLTMLVGCGGKETVTDSDSGTETNVVESEVLSQEETQELETTEVATNETESETTPTTEMTTPTPTEEPTPEPTEEPTPTPEPVHEHSYAETILQQATCSTAGTKLYTCSCGHSYEKEYYGECVGDGNRVIVKQPNCTSVGVTAEHCIYCGWEMYGESIPAAGHVPGNTWLYFPDTGGYYFTCVSCNALCPSTTPPPEGAEIHENTPIDSNTLQPINP